MTNLAKTEEAELVNENDKAVTDEIKESDDDYRKRIQLAKEMEPMRLTNWFVDCPCTVLIVSFGILFLITGVVVTNGWIALTDPGNRDFLLWKDPIVVNNDKRTLAYEYLEKYDGDKTKDIRSQNEGGWNIYVIF